METIFGDGHDGGGNLERNEQIAMLQSGADDGVMNYRTTKMDDMEENYQSNANNKRGNAAVGGTQARRQKRLLKKVGISCLEFLVESTMGKETTYILITNHV